MMDLISKMKTAIWKRRAPRLRDRRGHYASSALSCMREQYWRAIGEPKTNGPDYVSSVRMMLGDCVETMLRERVLKHMHFLGEHFIADQVKVGGTTPDWDGYMDALMTSSLSPSATTGEGSDYENYVIEIKAIFGFGADLMLPMRGGHGVPKDSHAVQLGLYLKDAAEKGLCKDGWLVYFCMSDKSLGSIVGFKCEYDAPYINVTRYRAIDTREKGTPLIDMPLDLKYDINKLAIERWKTLDKHIADKVVPEPDYKYKYDITPELLQEKEASGRYKISDSKLIKAINGEVILGDWQPKYSDYKDKQLAMLSEEERLHNEDERAMMKAEYKRRHPQQQWQKVNRRVNRLASCMLIPFVVATRRNLTSSLTLTY